MSLDLDLDSCIYRELVKVNSPTVMDAHSLLTPAVENAMYVASMWMPILCNPVREEISERYYPIYIPADACEICVVLADVTGLQANKWRLYNGDEEITEFEMEATAGFIYHDVNHILTIDTKTYSTRTFILKMIVGSDYLEPFTCYYRIRQAV